MKKLIVGIGILIAVSLISWGFVFFNQQATWNQPLKSLSETEVARISVIHRPDNIRKEIVEDRSKIHQIIVALQKLKVGKTIKSNESNGELVEYTLVMNTGDHKQIVVTSNVIGIDGTLYMAEPTTTVEPIALYQALPDARCKLID